MSDYKIEKGANGFSQKYWDENYYDPETMDGIGNLNQHLGYIKNFFGIEYIDLSSVIDLGFGLGHFLRSFVEEFRPYKVMGIEPSAVAFDRFNPQDLKKIKSTKVKLEQIDLLGWAEKSYRGWDRFDLGICTSVFQYLSEEELKRIIPLMSQRVKYLYLTVPTDKELSYQREEVEFFDHYALSRPRDFYLELLQPHFTIVSSRILESKVFFDENSTSFTDLLFRF